MAFGTCCRDFAKPASICCRRSWHDDSLAVLRRTDSQVILLRTSLLLLSKEEQISVSLLSCTRIEARHIVSGAPIDSVGWSSGNCISSETPTGLRETLSAAAFLAPGTWTIRNRNRSVFSLRFRRRDFSMSCCDLSPNTLTSGLWSTAIIKLSQPRTKWRDFSSASTTASASPSIGAYLDSALLVNRLPTRVTRHPLVQHKGLMGWQSQCFCVSQKPIPDLLQSVARQVGLPYQKFPHLSESRWLWHS